MFYKRDRCYLTSEELLACYKVVKSEKGHDHSVQLRKKLLQISSTGKKQPSPPSACLQTPEAVLGHTLFLSQVYSFIFCCLLHSEEFAALVFSHRVGHFSVCCPRGALTSSKHQTMAPAVEHPRQCRQYVHPWQPTWILLFRNSHMQVKCLITGRLSLVLSFFYFSESSDSLMCVNTHVHTRIYRAYFKYFCFFFFFS